MKEYVLPKLQLRESHSIGTMKIGISFNTLSKSNVSGRTEKQKKTVFNGSGDGEASASKKIPPATSMLWVRNLRRFIGFGTGLGSEALMGMPQFKYYENGV